MMGSYHDNVDGVDKRKKVRIRWYHDLFRHVDHPVLEFKLKHGVVGSKIQYPFPSFDFDKSFTESGFSKIIRSCDLPEEAKSQLIQREPVLVNRYLRWYYATPDQVFRVTIDSGLTFYHLSKIHNRFLKKQVDHSNIVVELKYQLDDDLKGSRISAGFPFRMTRSSKYVQGIEQVYI